MDITETFRPTDRADWRRWLREHHTTKTEIWVVYRDRGERVPLDYLDIVEEALCFGWIDGIGKRFSETEKAQRVTPRRRRSHWTELNKERVRRLERIGQMTDAGRKILPDLETPFIVPDDIRHAIDADPEARRHFAELPDLYVRVRIGYIEEMRKQAEEFDRRLRNFLKQTRAGRQFGNWNDGGRLSDPD